MSQLLLPRPHPPGQLPGPCACSVPLPVPVTALAVAAVQPLQWEVVPEVCCYRVIQITGVTTSAWAAALPLRPP